ATAASQSATQAAAARDAAKQSQSAAKTSETNAASHKKAAATSASNAATSETNAGASATASASSAAEAKGHADRAEEAADPDGLRNEMTKQFAALVDGAPEDLDTIREIAEYAQANRGITDQLNAAIGNKANKSHTHSQSQVKGLTTALDGKAAKSHTHSQSQVTGLTTALSGKADTGHKHTTSEITDYPGHTAVIGASSYGKIPVRESDSDNLRVGYSPSQKYHATSKKYVDDEVAKKANTSHTHTTSQISGLGTALNGKADKSYVDSRPALFSGVGAPPTSIPGATVGDWWLDTSTMELHKITGV